MKINTFKGMAIDDTLRDLQMTETNLLDNPFRLGSMMYFEVIKEARKLVAEGRYNLTEIDKQVLETNLGEYDIYEQQISQIFANL